MALILVGGPAVLLGKLERFFFLYRGSELELYENLRRNFYQVGHFVAPENSDMRTRFMKPLGSLDIIRAVIHVCGVK